MSFLGKIFNDIVDITSAPLKVGTKVFDKTVGSALDSDLTCFVDEVKETIKTDN